MKYIMIAISGAADHPSEELNDKTPFEVAKIPNLHFFAKSGKVGQIKLYPDRFEPYPDITFLNLLGYDADKVYTGLGPLEAANMELKLEDNEIPFRMNFITESNGVLADPTGGHISVKEAKALVNFLNKKVASDFVRFFGGVGYRHVAVIKDAHGFQALSAKTFCPYDIIGKRIDEFLPKGPGGELLKKLMFDTKLLLQDHEINQVRVDLGENPANMAWLWGQGPRPKLEKFSQIFGMSGSLVSDAEYAKGIARLIGLTVVESDARSEDLAANYEKKGKQILEELKEKDFVCVQLRDCDEAARDGDFRAKVAVLEACDFYILSKIKSYIEQEKEARVLITPCHALPWKTRKRTRDMVPFVVAGKNIMPDSSEKFSEVTARVSEWKINKSAELIRSFAAK